VCVEAFRLFCRETYAELDEETKRQKIAANRPRMKAINDESLAGARRRGYQWTGPELEVLSRRDLTNREVAEMLGRSYYGVVHKRRQLDEDEPIPAWLAGERSRLH
jgi:hypothetical protein